MELVFQVLDLVLHALLLVVPINHEVFIEEVDWKLIRSLHLNIIRAEIPKKTRENLLSH